MKASQSARPFRETGLSPPVSRLVELSRRAFPPMAERQRVSGFAELQAKARARRGARVARAIPWAIAASACCAFAFIVFRHTNHPSTLSFRVDGQTGTAASEVEADAVSSPSIRFSDGSEVALEAKARVHVRALSDHGARVALEAGRAHVYVVHAPETRWFVEAGPFVVNVTGTAFQIGWSPAERRFDVQLENGSVTVGGPTPDSLIVLHAGQWLTVRGSEVLIRDLGGPEQATQEPATSPSWGAGGGGAVASPAEGSEARATDPAPRLGAERGRARVGGEPNQHHWASALAKGRFEWIVDEALREGLDTALSESQSDDLSALGDAARYTRRHDIARRALVAQRRRFPTSERARTAAFLLGRLSEADGYDTAALSWFETYLSDAPEGPLASEALGRKMNLVQKHEGRPSAVTVAEAYLRRFPEGTYAEAARAITRTP